MMQEHPLLNVSVTEVLPDDRRRFLVVTGTLARSGQPWTLVLESQDDYWISRREVPGLFSPEAAVSGYLLGREAVPDPIGLLTRVNERVRAEYYRVLREKMEGDLRRAELTSELVRLRVRIASLRRLMRPEPEGRKRAPASRSPRRRRTS